MIRITVKEECNGCGICAKQCPTNVLKVVNGKSKAEMIDDCMVCKLCEVVCPLHGIAAEEI